MSGLYVKLDAEYASDDKMVEAGPLAELLFVRALCFCKRNSTSDGEISFAQLAVVAVGIPNPKRYANRLVEVGALQSTERGWRIGSWLKRNRSSADIQAQLDMASTLGIQGNHDRWHKGPDGKPSPKCPICIGEHRQTRSGNPTNPDRESDFKVSPKEEEETKPETEVKPETEPKTKPSSSSSVDNSEEEDDNLLLRSPLVVAEAMHIVADRLTQKNAKGDAFSYHKRILHDTERLKDLIALYAEAPLATAKTLATAHLEPHDYTATRAKQPWYADPNCQACAGDGWATRSGTANELAPCSCRQPDPYIATVTPIRPA